MADKFTDLDTLKQHLKKSDYRILYLNRNSQVTVLSVHGGEIEPGTSAIARGVAGRYFNLFDFQALEPERAREMHVTSTRFRDPALSELLAQSRLAVSVHGMGNQGTATIWLGGKNKRLKEIVLNILRGQGFDVNPEGPRYRGESDENVVNLPSEQGVQLEISTELMAELFTGPAYRKDRKRLVTTDRFNTLVSSLRLAVRLYLTHHPRNAA